MEELILTSASQEEFEGKLQRQIERKKIDLSQKFKDLDETFTMLSKKLCIVIDGPTLAFAFTSPKTANAFFKLGLLASSVICCRVSPK
mmetsp:Transcript_28576/g.27567  ORF Transcript_28576/g.27567 Transcript_28576/m.27567 type:complete len:88 (+) Transcript_28576:2321-2584(+)